MRPCLVWAAAVGEKWATQALTCVELQLWHLDWSADVCAQ